MYKEWQTPLPRINSTTHALEALCTDKITHPQTVGSGHCLKCNEQRVTGARFPLIEVLVTAQKRSENLQDVPISVAAVSGSKLDEVGVENIEDLTKLVPNIHLTQTGLSTQMRIRGIGSDNSQGLSNRWAPIKMVFTTAAPSS